MLDDPKPEADGYVGTVLALRGLHQPIFVEQCHVGRDIYGKMRNLDFSGARCRGYSAGAEQWVKSQAGNKLLPVLSLSEINRFRHKVAFERQTQS